MFSSQVEITIRAESERVRGEILGKLYFYTAFLSVIVSKPSQNPKIFILSIYVLLSGKDVSI